MTNDITPNRRIDPASPINDGTPIADGREFRAMVTIEQTQRLAERALAALDDENLPEGVAVDHVHQLLTALVDLTNLRTVSEVRNPADTDAISANATEGVRLALEQFDTEHRALAATYSRITGQYKPEQ